MTYPLSSQDWSRPWHSINDGYAALPDGEAQKADALVVQRTW